MFDLYRSAIALELEKGEPLSIDELANVIGYTVSEKNWTHIFWNIVYDNEWMHLSHDVIINYLGYPVARGVYSMVCGIVKERYTEGIDYQEVPKEHELVATYKMPGGNRKHYIITSAVFKHLLEEAKTNRSAEAMHGFLVAENLAMFTQHYTIAINSLIGSVIVENMQNSIDDVDPSDTQTILALENIKKPIVDELELISVIVSEYSQLHKIVTSQDMKQLARAFIKKRDNY